MTEEELNKANALAHLITLGFEEDLAKQAIKLSGKIYVNTMSSLQDQLLAIEDKKLQSLTIGLLGPTIAKKAKLFCEMLNIEIAFAQLDKAENVIIITEE